MHRGSLFHENGKVVRRRSKNRARPRGSSVRTDAIPFRVRVFADTSKTERDNMTIKRGFTVKKGAGALAIAATVLLAAQHAQAGGHLSKDDAAKLIVGNTISGKHFKGAKNDSYIAPDGTVSAKRGGNAMKGEWKFADDGGHCIKWAGGDTFNCLYIVDKGNGNYEKVKKNGKTIISFHVAPGKMEGL